MKIGQYIKMKRVAAGLSQQQLYERSKYFGATNGRSVISRIENDQYIVTLRLASQLAAVFEMSLSEFIAEWEMKNHVSKPKTRKVSQSE